MKEDTLHNAFRLACSGKSMGEAEHSREYARTLLLFQSREHAGKLLLFQSREYAGTLLLFQSRVYAGMPLLFPIFGHMSTGAETETVAFISAENRRTWYELLPQWVYI